MKEQLSKLNLAGVFDKVYIIDDDEVTLYLTGLVISLYAPECECVSFEDAQQAFDILQLDLKKGTAPSLVFLDLNMPYMDGFALLDALRESEDTLRETLAIYMLTSSISETDKENSLQHPLVQGYIEKPLSMEKLEEISAFHSSVS